MRNSSTNFLILLLLLRNARGELVPDRNNCYWIRNIQFIDCSSTGDGGAFCINSDSASLVCEGVIFSGCSSGGGGGGCYFTGSTSTFVRTCGKSCTASVSSFARIIGIVSGTPAVINESLWYECYSATSSSLYVRIFTCSLTNFNSTDNNCGEEHGSGMKISEGVSISKYGTLSKMTTINCIDIYQAPDTAVFYRCNIVDIDASHCVVFSTNSASEFQECVILRCSAGVAMFCHWGDWGTITLNNCVVCSYTQSPLLLSTFQCTSSGTEHALVHVRMTNCYIETPHYTPPFGNRRLLRVLVSFSCAISQLV